MKSIKRLLVSCSITVLLLITVSVLPAQQVNYPSEIQYPVLYDTSPSLLDIIDNAPPGQPTRETGREVLSHDIVETAVQREPLLNYDPVLQNQQGVNRLLETFVNIEGVNNLADVHPPDPNGDIGPDHYFQTVNTHFAIYDRSGTLLMGPYSIDSLWAGFTGEWTTMNKSDPIVLYDHLADRWFVSIVAFNLNTWNFYELIAVSQSSDPLGAWYRYSYHFNYLLDYPKFGVWPDGYYMSANRYNPYFIFIGMAAYVFERDSMLVGNEARLVSFTSFTDNTAGKGLLPSDLDGVPPPTDSPNYFAYIVDGETQGGDDRLGIFELSVNRCDALLGGDSASHLSK
ncbi:MAG: hypothetical protein ACE5D7_11710, partial [Fidelibacterota bacterium]